MRRLIGMRWVALAALALGPGGCSGPEAPPAKPPAPTVGGKASFNEAKAIEKIYQAGYTGISKMRRDPDGVWRGQAMRKGSQTLVAVSVTADGPVVAR